MGKFDHVVIVSDIDGTFLNREKQIVPRNLAALESFVREGGRFTFASGRVPLNMVRTMSAALPYVNAPAILCNGCCLYDLTRMQEVEAYYPDCAVIKDIQRLCSVRYPALGFRVSMPDGMLVERINAPIVGDLAKFLDVTTVLPVDDWPERPYYKAVARGEWALLEALRAEIEERWPGYLALSYSECEFLEMLHTGCSKGVLLGRLREYCTVDGIKPTVYAVGDYENDYEMLLAADVAVCPTNAMPMIREICQLSPASNDEGVIAALIETLAAMS